jgi:hypothetical protein
MSHTKCFSPTQTLILHLKAGLDFPFPWPISDRSDAFYRKQYFYQKHHLQSHSAQAEILSQ